MPPGTVCRVQPTSLPPVGCPGGDRRLSPGPQESDPMSSNLSRVALIGSLVAAATFATIPGGDAAGAAPGCVLERVGDDVTLSFEADSGSTVIRRDGRWLATLPAGSTTYLDASAPVDATYLVRTRPAGVVTDTPCEDAAVADDGVVDELPSCVLERVGDDVNLSFEAHTASSIIRRNGNWLATLPAGSTTYLDTSAPVDATYLVRIRPNGVVTDSQCSQTIVDEAIVDENIEEPIDDPVQDDPGDVVGVAPSCVLELSLIHI